MRVSFSRSIGSYPVQHAPKRQHESLSEEIEKRTSEAADFRWRNERTGNFRIYTRPASCIQPKAEMVIGQPGSSRRFNLFPEGRGGGSGHAHDEVNSSLSSSRRQRRQLPEHRNVRDKTDEIS
ncbi:hypothetical protein KM043_015362 [Ampulex compressa]|nr:hypothetical protein KM043_015362 [Ampulex compressa]